MAPNGIEIRGARARPLDFNKVVVRPGTTNDRYPCGVPWISLLCDRSFILWIRRGFDLEPQGGSILKPRVSEAPPWVGVIPTPQPCKGCISGLSIIWVISNLHVRLIAISRQGWGVANPYTTLSGLGMWLHPYPGWRFAYPGLRYKTPLGFGSRPCGSVCPPHGHHPVSGCISRHLVAL